MSIIYGVVSETAAEALAPLDRQVETKWKLAPKTIAGSDGTQITLKVAGSSGCFGQAETATHFLTYSGIIQAPFPEVADYQPIDRPDDIAALLLKRFVDFPQTFLNDVIGQFVVIVGDKRYPRATVATDASGLRKAYYTNTPNGIFFSTNLHLLSGAFPSGPRPNREVEDFFLGYEFLPDSQTLYQDVFRLRSARLDIEGNHLEEATIQACPAQANTADPPQTTDEGKVVADLYEVFMETMKLLMPSDKRVGVAMGGFDSALVASALCRLGKTVETYSFSFERNELNQPMIDRFCDAVPVKHHWVPITADVIAKGLEEYALWFNQIASQPHYLIQFGHVIATMQKHGIMHTFTGDGCDEVFLGYPIVHKRATIFSRMGRLPLPVRNLLLWLLSSALLERNLGQPLRILRNIITILARTEPTRGHITNRIFDDITLAHIRKSAPPVQPKSSEQILEELALGLDSLSPIRLAYHGKAAPGLNATRNEGAVSMSGLTIQSPFTHPMLTSFAKKLPDELSRPKEKSKSAVTGKYILMRMAEDHGLLPSEIIYQPKASPVTSLSDYWLMNDLQNLVKQLLTDLPFQYDRRNIQALSSYKLAEELFRKRTLGQFAFKNVSLLLTYARYFSQNGSTT